jgi:hypothetical protein
MRARHTARHHHVLKRQTLAMTQFDEQTVSDAAQQSARAPLNQALQERPWLAGQVWERKSLSFVPNCRVVAQTLLCVGTTRPAPRKAIIDWVRERRKENLNAYSFFRSLFLLSDFHVAALSVSRRPCVAFRPFCVSFRIFLNLLVLIDMTEPHLSHLRSRRLCQESTWSLVGSSSSSFPFSPLSPAT